MTRARRSDLLFVAALGCVLCLYLALATPNLGASAFWSDEADTACTARAVLHTGLPAVGCGGDRLGTAAYNYNRAGLEASHGWAPYYLVAAAFAAFGPTERAGRVPFVLCGALVLVATALLGRLLLGRFAGVLAAAVLSIQPGFIQHARQCRYYMLALLCVVAVVWLHERLRRGRGHWALLCLAWLALFHSFQLFFGVLAASVIAVEAARRVRVRLSPSVDPQSTTEAPFARVAIGCLVLIGPWIAFFAWGRDSGVLSPSLDFAEALSRARAVLSAGMGLFPILFPLGLVPLAIGRRSYLPPALLIVAAAVVAMMPAALIAGTSGTFTARYYLFVYPLGALVAARGALLLADRRAWRILAVAMVVGLIPGVPDRLDLAGSAIADVRTTWRQAESAQAYYRRPPRPDPERRAIAAAREAARGLPLALVGDLRLREYGWYLGPETVVLDVRRGRNRPASAYAVIVDPDGADSWPIRDGLPAGLVDGCAVETCENCGLRWANQAERLDFYPLLYPPPGETPRLAIYRCGAGERP